MDPPPPPPPPELNHEQNPEPKTASPVSERGAACISDKAQEQQGEGKSSALAFCSAERCDYYLKVLLEPDISRWLDCKEVDSWDLNMFSDITEEEGRELDNCCGLASLDHLELPNDLFLVEDVMNSETVTTEKWYRISSIILKASSQYFQECFASSNEQEENVLTLHMKESEEPAFRKLLEFMHGISSPSTTDPLNLSDAINVAEKFQVHLWVKICKEELINRFKSLQHPEIMSLPLAAVTEILKSDDLEVRSEDDVYKFTLEWALRNYRTKQQRHKVMESELGSLIRFHYMSNDMLVHCNTNYDEFFSMQFIREILRTAINDKQKVPERHFVERAYKHKPLMVSEVLEPRRSCTIWLTFTKDECLRLVRSSPVRSMDFDFHDGRFFIQVAAARDGRFLLSLEVVCLPSHDYFLCTAASKAKGDGEYVGIHSWEFGLRTQDSGLYQDLFGTPLSEFLRDDSSYFNDGKLHLQVKIEAIQQPRFRIRMNWLRSQTNNL